MSVKDRFNVTTGLFEAYLRTIYYVSPTQTEDRIGAVAPRVQLEVTKSGIRIGD